MQAKALDFKKTMIRGAVSLSALFLIVACATKGEFKWPAENPFLGFESKKLSDYSEGRIPFRLVFTSNVMGELEPCGCAVGPKGGLDRRLNFILDNVKPNETSWPYLIVDAGNSILPTPRVDNVRAKAYQEVALGIFKASKKMGVAVQNVAYLDLGFGVQFLKKASQDSGLPLVSASWIDAQNNLVFDSHKEFLVGANQVVVTGLSAGLDGAREDLKLSVRDPSEALSSIISKISKNSILIVLSDLGQPKDEELARKFSERNMIFVGSRDLGGLSLPKQTGASVMVQGQFRGQQWGLLDFYHKPQSEGWILVDKMPYFAGLWSQLVARKNLDRSRITKGEELDLEEKRHSESARDLFAYAPLKPENKSIYMYKLEDLGDQYRKSNELSAEMSRLINLRK